MQPKYPNLNPSMIPEESYNPENGQVNVAHGNFLSIGAAMGNRGQGSA